MTPESVLVKGTGLRVGSPEASRIHVPELSLGLGVTALVGRNGAGKSSLLAALAGDVDFTGELRVARDGSTISGWPGPGDVTVVDHDASAPAWWRVSRCLDFAEWLAASDSPAVDRDVVVEVLELEGLLERRFRTLSAGESQRVALAMGLLQDSPVYLLDEPTGNVDLALAPRIGRMLNQVATSRVVVLATHDLALLRALQARILWLERGEVRADTAALPIHEADQIRSRLDTLLERL